MSGLVFEKLTQTLQAGEVWRLAIAADFFRIAAASWPVKVRILKAGRILGEMDGWQAGDFVRDVQFDAVEIEAGSIAQTVTVQIAGGGVGSDRVLGEVSVVDGGIARTKAGVAFFAGGGQSLVAGEYARIQLWNPPSSGKLIAVKNIYFGKIANGGVGLFKSGAALATLKNPPTSKNLGGSGAVSELRSDTTASAQTPADQISAFLVQAYSTEKIEMQEPIVIEPGKGLIGRSSQAGDTIECAFDFIEIEQ